MDLCGLPANAGNEGVSLKSVLAKPATAKDRSVIQSNGGSMAVINREWRYTRYENGEEELYHVSKDPGEHDNLAGQPELAEVVMRIMLRSSSRSTVSPSDENAAMICPRRG